MMPRWMLLLWLLPPLLLGLSPKGQEKTEEIWSVERFSGTLCGQTVTVTRKLWEEGALAGDGQGASPRPEAVFALRCLRAERPKAVMAVEKRSGYAAAVTPPDRETGEWLMENAWRFGLTAAWETEGRGDRVCLRFVGLPHAAAMRALDVDLAGYLAFLRGAGRAVLRLNGRAVAWIFCVPAGEAVSFTLPEGAVWEISGDGAGNVIVAVRAGC